MENLSQEELTVLLESHLQTTLYCGLWREFAAKAQAAGMNEEVTATCERALLISCVGKNLVAEITLTGWLQQNCSMSMMRTHPSQLFTDDPYNTARAISTYDELCSELMSHGSVDFASKRRSFGLTSEIDWAGKSFAVALSLRLTLSESAV